MVRTTDALTRGYTRRPVTDEPWRFYCPGCGSVSPRVELRTVGDSAIRCNGCGIYLDRLEDRARERREPVASVLGGDPP